MSENAIFLSLLKMFNGCVNVLTFAKKELCLQGSHRLEKYLNLEGFLEKSMKIKSALKSTGK